MDILITIGITIGILLILPTILGILYLLACIYDTKYGKIILGIIGICLFIFLLFYNIHYALVEVNIIKPFLPF